ncbi:MAG: hypothetical protein KF810_22900 [Rhizobiaceae bacterium]|nr:hypothetical protein [Rhizobiaceae bacterium]
MENGRLSGVIGRHKSPLLACTAVSVFAIAGLMSPEASASCQLTTGPSGPANNIYTCTGSSNSPSPFTAQGDGFAVGVGSYISPPTPPVESTATITGNGTGLTVDAKTFDGDITITPNSKIDLANNNGFDLRHGLIVKAGNNPVGGVNINVDGLVRSNDTYNLGLARSGADSLQLDGKAQSIFTVNVSSGGKIGGGSGSNGINVLDAGTVTINNAGAIEAGSALTQIAVILPTPTQTGNAIKVGDLLAGAIAGKAEINNTGTITGNGGELSPVIFIRATGGAKINNNEGGRIGDDGTGYDEYVLASAGSGGNTEINNYGTINGALNYALATGDVVFNNYSNNSWNTSGFTFFGLGNDTENNEGGTPPPVALSRPSAS